MGKYDIILKELKYSYQNLPIIAISIEKVFSMQYTRESPKNNL